MCCAPSRPLYILFSQRNVRLPATLMGLISSRGCFLFSHKGAFSFSQKNTDEQNTQGFTETLSQPISQNLTANVS